MSYLEIGRRVAVVGGRHFGRAGSVAEKPTGYPETYRVRLDGGQTVSVAPNDIAAVRA